MGQAIYTKQERERMDAAANANTKIHDIANLWPSMAEDEWAEFLADIKANGLLDPILRWHGAIVDGKHRYRACQETGVAPRFDDLPGDWDEWRVVTHCSSKHRRRNLTPAQRNAVAAEAIEKFRRPMGRPTDVEKVASTDATYGKAAEHAARAMGGSSAGVERAVFVRERAPEVHELVKAGKLSGLQAERLAKEPDAARRAAKISQLDTGARTDDAGDSWGTPPEWIDLARTVMGDIDLDPASNNEAQQVVKAKRFFTKDTNGLAKPWAGRVWMNPPYSQPLVTQFAEKLVDHVTSGDVVEACVLVNNATDARFLQLLLSRCSAALFPRGRIPFLIPGSGESLTGTRQGQAFVYFGPNVAKFVEFAQPLGWVGVSP